MQQALTQSETVCDQVKKVEEKKIARCLINSKTKQSMKQILSLKKTTTKNTLEQHYGVPAKHYGKLG